MSGQGSPSLGLGTAAKAKDAQRRHDRDIQGTDGETENGSSLFLF